MLIEADLHTHTVASTHGFSTITENCARAKELGVKCLAMTDHGPAMPDSPHIWHFGNMRVLPRKILGVTVLKGVEANIIDYDGGLDVCDGSPYKFEFVVASYHRYYFENFERQSEETVTKGYLKLLENPSVDMIGHPTTKHFPVDWRVLVSAAKEAGVLLELNESSIRDGKSPKETVVEMLLECKKQRCPIAVNTDSHFWGTIAETPISEQILQELGFPRGLIANADWAELRERILKRRPCLDI